MNTTRPNTGPTGAPADPLAAAEAVCARLGGRLNLPGGHGAALMLHGSTEQAASVAQVATALALTDIAASLRLLCGRAPAQAPAAPDA